VKPVIGVGGDVRSEPEPAVRLKLSYLDAVRQSGGVPVILPAGAPEDVAVLLERVDGIVLTGGGDIDTRLLGIPLHPDAEVMDPRRQAFDLALAAAVLERPIPALGICLGMQMLAVAAGARLHQHLPDAGFAQLLDHRSGHEVVVDPASRLSRAMGATRAQVVSHHHQAVAEAPASFRPVATAADGVLEAIELPGDRFLVGVQWHPERDLDAPATRSLFDALVAAASARRRS
jgi:putative glutamine amidotransferase